MGIKGIYQEIGPGERIALSKLALLTFEEKGRPLRLAIDISIWLFQIQSGKGGTNPALRTFYYRLLRLISLSIHPLFVFDGPNKPPFKRGKRTGPNVASIPEFLAKQLLKQFGLPFHIAPGEAEAECALLQQENVVDAVLSEDVDTLMFGSGLTLRNWSPEGSLKTKTFTHVNMYDAKKTKAGRAGLDREGMILVALMSGGDYIPEGIPGCGPKTACEAARAGFGADLCKLSRSDADGLAQWKDRLIHELRTNESKWFRAKHKALVIPDDFPRRDVLRYYTHPCVSSLEKVATIRQNLRWDQEIDVAGLRTFVGEAFDWLCISGAKKFVRNLAPALLVRELRLRSTESSTVSDDPHDIAQREAELIKTIHLKRQHVSTDSMTELRVSFVPISLVKIDLDAEEPDPEILGTDDDDSEADEPLPSADHEEPMELTGPKKKRGPPTYDPTILEKVWIMETFIRVGVPLKMQDWEESFRTANKVAAAKSQAKSAGKPLKSTARGGMVVGALNQYTKVTKPGIKPVDNSAAKKKSGDDTTQTMEPVPLPKTCSTAQVDTSAQSARPVFRAPPAVPAITSKATQPIVIDILSSPDAGVAKRQRTLRRSQSDTSSITPAYSIGTYPSIDLSGISSSIHRNTDFDLEPVMELPPSVTTRRHKSPLRRANTLGNNFVDLILPAPSTLPCKKGTLVEAATTIAEVNLAQLPTTPKKKKGQNVMNHTIITISSPAETPRSRQKSIVDYLSPKPTKTGNTEAISPSPIRQRPLPNTKPIAKPIFRMPLSDLQGTSIGGLEMGNTEHERVQKLRRVIRLRDSLPGAWQAEAGSVEDVGVGKKRRREWRASQVEVLDLSSFQ